MNKGNLSKLFGSIQDWSVKSNTLHFHLLSNLKNQLREFFNIKEIELLNEVLLNKITFYILCILFCDLAQVLLLLKGIFLISDKLGDMILKFA